MNMMSQDARTWITLGLVALFLGLWIWTELTEYRERSNFNTEVIEFVSKGDRFTQEEGDDLIRRVEELEKTQ